MPAESTDRKFRDALGYCPTGVAIAAAPVLFVSPKIAELMRARIAL